MAPHRASHCRFLSAVTVVLTLGACSDPSTKPAVADFIPTSLQPETHLRGQVIDLTTRLPIADARVSTLGQSSTSLGDGSYNLQRLRAAAVDLITVREGYDTARTLLALKGGDQEFTIRMTAK